MMSVTSAAAQWLRELRMDADLTQEDLAYACGISDRTLRSMEAGTAGQPRRDTLQRIAAALNLDVAEQARFLDAWRTHGRRPRAYDELFDQIRPTKSVSERLIEQRDLIRDISLSERTLIGPDRCELQFRALRTVQAGGDGVDRYLWLTGADPQTLVPELLVPTWLDNCRAGNTHVLVEEKAKAFEFLFDRTLEPGEMYSFGFEYSRGDARRLDAKVPPIETEALLGLRAPAALLTVQAEFSPGITPARLRRVEQATVDGPEGKTTELELSPFGVATATVIRPTAGVHGLRWVWPEAEATLDSSG
jgi:transcriptional regulator with XRE-family HTH domain